MHFQTGEKEKRIVLAKQLRDKGFTIRDISDYFSVQENTVKEYLEMEHEVSSTSEIGDVKEKAKGLLQFTDKTVSTNDYFKQKPNQEGFQCAICRKYRKYIAGMKWREEIYMCKDCFKSLTPEQIRLLPP